MINVIELIPTLCMGGAEALVRDYSLLINKETFNIHVVVIDHKYGTHNEKVLEEAGINVTYLSDDITDSNVVIRLCKKVLRKVNRYVKWWSIVHRERPDVIHMHLHLGKYMKILPLKKMGSKLIMTIHNPLDYYFSKDKSDGDKYSEYLEVQRLIDKYGLKLVALHDAMKLELKDYFHTDNVDVLNNGVMLDRFSPTLYDSRITREELGIEENAYVIGNVASLTYQKNHDLIVRVFTKIAQEYDDARLLLVGAGDQKEKILSHLQEADISDRVIMLSNRSDIPQLMNIMDVFFLPSRWEGFGNVMIEAQSMGLRCVVSSEVPDVTFVTDNITVCNLDDSDEVWMEALMNDGLPHAVKKYDIKDYDIRNVVKKLEILYQG